jgi:hypothetical protein
MEPPNKLMIMQVLGCFRYDSMILNGLTLVFLGAPCVIRGVLSEISVIRSSGSVPWPSWPCSSTGGTPVARLPKTEQGQRGLALLG